MGPYPGASQFLVVNCCGFGLGTQKMELEKGVGPSHPLLQEAGISSHWSIKAMFYSPLGPGCLILHPGGCSVQPRVCSGLDICL